MYYNLLLISNYYFGAKFIKLLCYENFLNIKYLNVGF